MSPMIITQNIMQQHMFVCLFHYPYYIAFVSSVFDIPDTISGSNYKNRDEKTEKGSQSLDLRRQNLV